MASSTDIDGLKIDLYEFLGLQKQGSAASTKEITRAGRQTSFRYHPDKVEATPENLEKFHLAQIAINILTDPEQKTKYDQQRDAKLRRKAEVDALDERRRKMAQDLEDRERSGGGSNIIARQKRTFSEREMKIRAAQEANRRKMEERNAQNRLQAEQKAAEERAQATKEASTNGSTGETGRTEDPPTSEGTGMEEGSVERSVKLCWSREGDGKSYDEDTIVDFFGKDSIEDAVMLKDKKRRIEGKGKVIMATAVVVFKDRSAASRAIDQRSGLLDRFESIELLGNGKEGR